MYSSRCCICVFFFFKQKTAYEMRISDWSSDVCSSDLARRAQVDPIHVHRKERKDRRGHRACGICAGTRQAATLVSVPGEHTVDCPPRSQTSLKANRVESRRGSATLHTDLRSEEHTSELQSLMSISYSVFCLKKK